MARILIVDDDRDHRLAFVTMLTRAGHEAVEAPEGESALEAILESPFDVVITDLQMPGMHGLELITLIRDLPSPPRMIAVTSTGETQLSVAQALGAAITINKPVFPDQLLGAVDEALAGDDTVLVVSDPPHRGVDLEAASAITGLDIFQTQLKFNFPGPEVLAASGPQRTSQIVASFEGAGVQVAVIDGSELAEIPWAESITTFEFTPDGLTATTQDRVVALDYESAAVAVYCRPPTDFRKNRPGLTASPLSLTGAALAQAVEWMARLDLFFVEQGSLQRISFIEGITDFSTLELPASARDGEGPEEATAECMRRFTRMEFDLRLRNVRPRSRYRHGLEPASDTRRRYSFGTPQLHSIMAAIAPELGELTQYELGTRLGFVTNRRRRWPESQ